MDRTVTNGILSVVVSLAAAAVFASPAHAHGRRSRECIAPNGTDDTAALQSALDRCGGADHRCVVSMCEGIFRIAPVRVRDFRGVLRGAGADRTVIEALPNLEVNANPWGYWNDDPLEGAPWPYLLQFIEGRAEIHDLAIEVPSPEDGGRPTSGWSGGWRWNQELAGALLLTGREPVDFEVGRVRVVGGPDPNGEFGTALLAAVHFQGLLFNPNDSGGYPVHPVRGRFHLSDCEFEGMLSGSPLWEIADAGVTITGNHYRSIVGMDVLDATRSRVVVHDNAWAVEAVGFEAVLNIDGEPSEENAFFVSRNRGTIGTLASSASGIFFWDPGGLEGEVDGSTVVFSRNRLTVGVGAEPAVSGIEAWGADRLWVYRNAVRGRAWVGVKADDTRGCRIVGNALGHLDTAGGPDVELGPGTSQCLAIVGKSDVVRDDGRDNRIFRR